ncbi:hypothetical protein [Methylocapsa palsarum]|uniref:Uncharacterized protein n=1 Tax=Methylocapsa palsarum TaxID=1612308 RepID=A0A1I4D7G6_9HYPH|nr:hypothetical protein [Methylocapsa palsarum]SFK88789.1 hypothetical protein SAMN05444581_1407 [Methylocapsa palsarum]
MPGKRTRFDTVGNDSARAGAAGAGCAAGRAALRVPLFGRYNVDLVVCGREANPTLTPVLTSTATDVIDTTKGTVHMVMGGGETSSPSNGLFFHPPHCRVIVSVGAPDPVTGKRPSVYVSEDAPWLAVRSAVHAYGFAAFTVDPGSQLGKLDESCLLRRRWARRAIVSVRDVQHCGAPAGTKGRPRDGISPLGLR